MFNYSYKSFGSVTAFVLLTLGACATAPERNLALERVKASLNELKSNPELADNAPVAIHEAEVAVATAARAESEAVRAHRVYLAERKVGIAKARAREVEARQAVVELEEVRRQVILKARTLEAKRARQAAERARMLAAARAEEARLARQEAMEARRGREEAAKAAAMARKEASTARELAKARAREAALARQEAAALQAKVAQLQSELDDLETRQTARGVVVTMRDVLFEVDKAELKPGAVRNLDTLVQFLQEYPQRTIRVEGHTDSTGNEAYNQGLSERRADSVHDLLVSNGVASSRIITVGYGEKYPVASNDSAAGRQQNRRVEIVLLKEGLDPNTPPPESKIGA